MKDIGTSDPLSSTRESGEPLVCPRGNGQGERGRSGQWPGRSRSGHQVDQVGVRSLIPSSITGPYWWRGLGQMCAGTSIPSTMPYSWYYRPCMTFDIARTRITASVTFRRAPPTAQPRTHLTSRLGPFVLHFHANCGQIMKYFMAHYPRESRGPGTGGLSRESYKSGR